MTAHHYTIEELEALVAQQGRAVSAAQRRSQSEHVPYHPPPMLRDIHREIYNAVYNAGGAVTCAQIAAAVGRKKTGRLQEHVRVLVEKQYLVCRKEPYRPNMDKHYYEVAR